MSNAVFQNPEKMAKLKAEREEKQRKKDEKQAEIEAQCRKEYEEKKNAANRAGSI